MKITIRQATDAEKATQIRAQWLARVSPKTTDADRRGWFPSWKPDSSRLSSWAARRAMTLFVDDLLRTSTVLVAHFDDVPGELIGWAAHDGARLHYVCVPKGYGRRGIARALMGQLSDVQALSPSYWTANGEALLGAVAPKGQ